jgi:hypothetical protein
MNNYGEQRPEDLDLIMSADETVIWEGKPVQKPYKWGKSLKMLPFGLIWGAIDIGIISTMVGNFFGGGHNGDSVLITWDYIRPILFIIAFFAIHMTPVWVMLHGVLTAGKAWRNEYYVITDKRILVSRGVSRTEVTEWPYQVLVAIRIRRDWVDGKFGVGDVVISTTRTKKSSKGRISDVELELTELEDPGEVFKIIAPLIQDYHSKHDGQEEYDIPSTGMPFLDKLIKYGMDRRSNS